MKINTFWFSCFIGFVVLGFLVSYVLGFLVSWFLGLSVSWVIGLLGSWFLHFLVSWLLRIRFPCCVCRLFCWVSWFQSFPNSKCLGSLVSKFQSSNDTISPRIHFMFSGRYWSQIQDSQGFITRIFMLFGARIFQKVQNFRFPKSWYFHTYDFEMILAFCWTIWRVRGSPEIKINGFGAQGHVRKSRNHENEGFSVSPTSKSKSYQSKVKQNNPTELLAISFPYM